MVKSSEQLLHRLFGHGRAKFPRMNKLLLQRGQLYFHIPVVITNSITVQIANGMKLCPKVRSYMTTNTKLAATPNNIR